MNQNDDERKRKRVRLEAERKEEEERGMREFEKIKRLEGARQQRKKLLGNLRKKGLLKPSKRDFEWIEERKKAWKLYRQIDDKIDDENDDKKMNKVGVDDENDDLEPNLERNALKLNL